MPTWKEILLKDRKRGEAFDAVMTRKFEKVLGELEEFVKHKEKVLQHQLENNEKIFRRVLENEASYRKKISEGTRRGLARAKKRGVKLGGARRTSKIDLKRLRRLAGRGFTQMQIAAKLGCSQALVSRLLKEKKLGRKK